MAYRTFWSPTATFIHLLRQLPINQQTLERSIVVFGYEDVPRTDVAMQDLCPFKGVRVSYAFIR